MARTFNFGILILLILGVTVLGKFGVGDPTSILDLGMILFGLFGLAGILKLPWDLYFEARSLLLDQRESIARGIDISKDDQDYAKKTSYRLFFLCLAIHFLAAGLSAGISYFSGGKIGYAFAGFFLVSTLFRPLGAFYQHMKARLNSMRSRAKYPREDVLSLLKKVKHLESGFDARGQTLSQEAVERQQRFEEFSRELQRAERRQNCLEEKITSKSQDYSAKVDRVLREFQDSISRLTSEKEILEGMRAFVRLVKES